MKPLSIIKVEFLEDYKIKLELSNYHAIIFNIQSKLNTTRFKDLNNKSIFKNGTVIDGKLIRWSPFIELSLDEILGTLANRYNKK